MKINSLILQGAALAVTTSFFACGGAPKPKPVVKVVKKEPLKDPRAPGVPSPAIDAFEVGVKAMQAKPPKFAAASEAFKKAVELYPAYIVGWLNLALSYEKLGRYKDAAETYQTLIDKRVIDRGVKMAMGRAIMLSGNVDEAIKIFRGVLQTNANDLQAQNNLAAAYLKKGDIETSLSYVKDVLAVQPKNVPAIVNLGLLYLKQKKLPLAQLMFEKALSYDKKNARAQNNLGLTYYAMSIKDRTSDTLPQAVLAFEKAIALDPTMDEARLNIASVFLDYLDYNRALTEFQAVRKRFPSHYQAMVGEADSLYGVGKYEEAVKLYLETLTMKDDNGEAILRTGKIYEQQLNKPKEALQYYKRYVVVSNPPKTDKIHQTIMLLEQAGMMQMKSVGGSQMAAPPAPAATPATGASEAPAKAPETPEAKSAEGEKAPKGDGDKKDKEAGKATATPKAAADGAKTAPEKKEDAGEQEPKAEGES